ncbi:MAG: hypothetical protein KIT84_35970 [Labilithrix sp.]|nr:hypothetical protein [Labilithrix sp.]MCW5816451.1 hypothetical protein [Labilithrix sp.]
MTLSCRVQLGGRRVQLDARDLLGEGGEGRVYRRGDVAVKVFTQPNAARAAKLRAFPRTLPAEVVAPIELCTDDGGDVVGYSMRLVEGATDLARFAQRKWRAGRATNSDVLAVLRALADVVDRLHAAGVVVGDLNDGNVVVTTPATAPRDTGAAAAPPAAAAAALVPWLIDADSMHLPAHPCVVAHERFLDPRFYGRDLARGGVFARETDWYALAVMAFTSLLFVHPYGGAHPSQPTLLRRAEARLSALRPDVKLPSSAARPDVLPDDALGWFERVFERDLRAPLPPALFDARFTACSCGTEHARTRCPACAVRANVAPVVRTCGKLRVSRVFYKLGARVVAAAFDGSIRWVSEEDGVLRREDESVVAPAGAHELVRIAANATWLAAGGAMKKLVAGKVVAEHPVGVVHGEVAADASALGLVHVQGDVLVRAEEGTRVGQVLERQTHVRTSATLGFAFYRAGGLTVAFVFDPRRGPLRQIEGFPPLAGRLRGWSAVFGPEHVLVTFATEVSGDVTHHAHLVDAAARIVASDDGAVLPPSLAGRAVGPGGSVLVATDAGLLLTRADAGAFTSGRLFPEAKDFARPDDDLLVGTGGTLYAVTDDEVTHLCFTG